MTTTSSGLTPFEKPAVPLVQRVAAAAAITSSYTLVGSIFGKPVVSLIIVSTLDQPVQLSLDGVNDFIPISIGSTTPVTIAISEKTNGIVLPGWRGVYVKEIGNPTTGSLYVSGFTLG